ncbi:MAG: hypothetical protein Q9165_001966 [Trypethelium subeluteriae]
MFPPASHPNASPSPSPKLSSSLTAQLLSSIHSSSPIIPHSAPSATTALPDTSLARKALQEKRRLVRVLTHRWGRNFPSFLEHPHHPKAVRLTDGSMRRARVGDADQAMRTLPPTLWSVDLLVQLREMAEAEEVDRVTAGRNIAVQIERRLKRRDGVKTVGMVAGDVRRAMVAIRRSLPEKQSSVDDSAPLDWPNLATEDGMEVEADGPPSANSSSSMTQLCSTATVPAADFAPFPSRAVRKLRRELEDIGFERRELYLDRQEARIRAALQDAQENHDLDEHSS